MGRDHGARVFLLSPARLDGARATQLRNGRSELARQLRTRTGAPIGEVFAFVSSLYFRGKLLYAQRFAVPPRAPGWVGSGVLVMKQNRGIIAAESRITLEHLLAFAATKIGAHEPGFVRPLLRDAEALAHVLGADGVAILLGSLATSKYTGPLTQALGSQLRYPEELRGCGDMARGSILLRRAREGAQLNYRSFVAFDPQGRDAPL